MVQEMEQLLAEVEARGETGVARLTPQPPTNPSRPRFRLTFWRKHTEQNAYGRHEAQVLLIDIINLATLERVADWQFFAYGKQMDALGDLQRGDVIEFNASIDEAGRLVRPTKIEKTR